MSQIKINRARHLSTTGRYPASFDAMLAAIPAPVVTGLTAKALAALIDAQWIACQDAKAIAEREAIDAGAVWDARRQTMCTIEAV